MKKLLFICALLFSSAGTMMAQDIITTKEGKDIQAKVVEISNTEIKYLDFENLEGPTYILNKSDVILIRYQNGKNEVFADSSKPQDDIYKPQTSAYVSEGMRYRDYKNLYDRHKYNRQFGDPYNPTLAGVASFLIPGLGQGLCDEWGRGIAIFGGYVLGSMGWAMSVVTSAYTYNYTSATYNASALVIGSALLLAYDVWNIVDAVQVAKIKDMYYQDIRGRQVSFDMSLTPCFTYINTPDANAPVVGLSLNLGF